MNTCSRYCDEHTFTKAVEAMSPAKRTPEELERLRASLLAHARRVVERDGAPALTMRALATEAGCALGLPYTVFENREELVGELIREEYRRLRVALDDFVSMAGTRTVAENLWTYAELLVQSPSMGLAHEVSHAPAIAEATDSDAAEMGLVDAIVTAVSSYLDAEKTAGRVDADVDQEAFAFLIGGAVHNLLWAGELYPRPEPEALRNMLAAVASHLAPRTTRRDR